MPHSWAAIGAIKIKFRFHSFSRTIAAYGTVHHKLHVPLISTSEDWSDNGWQETPTIDAQVEYREESSSLIFLHRERNQWPFIPCCMHVVQCWIWSITNFKVINICDDINDIETREFLTMLACQVCPSATLVRAEITCCWWFAMKFCMDNHGLQRTSPNAFGDLLTFPLAPSWGWVICNEWNVSI